MNFKYYLAIISFAFTACKATIPSELGDQYKITKEISADITNKKTDTSNVDNKNKQTPSRQLEAQEIDYKYSPKQHSSDIFRKNSKYSDAQYATYRISYKNKTIGTAFLYEIEYNNKNYKFLLTASHTLDGLEQYINNLSLYDCYTNKEIKISSFYKLNNQSDVAVIFTEPSQAIEEKKGLHSGRDHQLLEYEDVYTINYSIYEPEIINEKILSKGYVVGSEIDSDYIILYLNLLNKGGSGSAILSSENNDVIGLTTRRVVDNQSKSYTGLCYVLDIKKINNLLVDYIRINLMSDKLR